MLLGTKAMAFSYTRVKDLILIFSFEISVYFIVLVLLITILSLYITFFSFISLSLYDGGRLTTSDRQPGARWLQQPTTPVVGTIARTG